MSPTKLQILLKRRSVELLPAPRVLYLGAGTGANLAVMRSLMPRAVIYAVEFAPLPMSRLLKAFDADGRIIPVYADARHPERYASIVDKVDILYQDVAQPNQAEIAVRNAEYFLDEGILLMMCKLKSISSTLPKRGIIEQQHGILDTAFDMQDVVNLTPTFREHVCFVAVRR